VDIYIIFMRALPRLHQWFVQFVQGCIKSWNIGDASRQLGSSEPLQHSIEHSRQRQLIHGFEIIYAAGKYSQS